MEEGGSSREKDNVLSLLCTGNLQTIRPTHACTAPHSPTQPHTAPHLHVSPLYVVVDVEGLCEGHVEKLHVIRSTDLRVCIGIGRGGRGVERGMKEGERWEGGGEGKGGEREGEGRGRRKGKV